MLIQRIATACLLLVSPLVRANPEKAAKIQQDWEKSVREWTAQAEGALTPEQRTKLLETRPDAAACAARMWACIAPSLKEPWAIEPAAWCRQISHGLREPGQTTSLFSSQIEDIKKAVINHHIARPDPQLYKLCQALAGLGDPLSLSILEKIENSNPDPKIQGVAALAASMIIKGLGDDGELMRKRLTYLRKAIINSADVELGSTTVADLAANELYQIRFLSKGRVAPELRGIDSEGRPFALSEQAGKVIVLVFWSSTIPEAEHVIEFTNEMTAKLKGKPVEVIGINHDPVEKLQALRKEGTVTWRNLSDPNNLLARDYRVGVWPMVYVLDHQRRIHYAGALGSFAELTADALAGEAR